MEENKKYFVRWNNNKAHLSEDGQKTFCGEKITGWHWHIDQDATLKEYVKIVRSRCIHCLRNARIVLVIEKFQEEK